MKVYKLSLFGMNPTQHLSHCATVSTENRYSVVNIKKEPGTLKEETTAYYGEYFDGRSDKLQDVPDEYKVKLEEAEFIVKGGINAKIKDVKTNEDTSTVLKKSVKEETLEPDEKDIVLAENEDVNINIGNHQNENDPLQSAFQGFEDKCCDKVVKVECVFLEENDIEETVESTAHTGKQESREIVQGKCVTLVILRLKTSAARC